MAFCFLKARRKGNEDMAISKKVKSVLDGASWIRRMFEEGEEMKRIHGEENVFDFSLGNPDVEPPDSLKKQLKALAEDRVVGKSLELFLERIRRFDVGVSEGEVEDVFLSMDSLHLFAFLEHTPNPGGSVQNAFHLFRNSHFLVPLSACF